MTVYVDDAYLPYGRMRMCHLMADSVEELHAFAAQLGIKRKWYQPDFIHPHYDISIGKRKRAVALGAVQLTCRQLVRWYLDKHSRVKTRTVIVDKHKRHDQYARALYKSLTKKGMARVINEDKGIIIYEIKETGDEQ